MNYFLFFLSVFIRSKPVMVNVSGEGIVGTHWIYIYVSVLDIISVVFNGMYVIFANQMADGNGIKVSVSSNIFSRIFYTNVFILVLGFQNRDLNEDLSFN